jgi:nucleoid DNA-binding protein
MNKSELIEEIIKKTSFSKIDLTRAVEALLEVHYRAVASWSGSVLAGFWEF